MPLAQSKPDDVSQGDWDAFDVPEATDAEFAQARRFADVHPRLLTADHAASRRAGVKGRISFRLSSDLVGAIKSTGPGYSRRVERVLRRALAAGDLAEN